MNTTIDNLVSISPLGSEWAVWIGRTKITCKDFNEAYALARTLKEDIAKNFDESKYSSSDEAWQDRISSMRWSEEYWLSQLP